MLSKDLLQILVCPACKQPLDYRESPESLKCTQCHRVYPVKDDIPIMLIDEAETVNDAEHDRLLAKAAAEGIQPTFEA